MGIQIEAVAKLPSSPSPLQKLILEGEEEEGLIESLLAAFPPRLPLRVIFPSGEILLRLPLAPPRLAILICY